MAGQNRNFGRTGFWCYCILMVWLLYGQRIGYISDAPYLEQMMGNMNLHPFRTIGNYLSAAQWTRDDALLRHIVINLAGNVVMFVPLGFFLPLNWQCFRNFWLLIVGVILIVSLVELIQLVTLLGSLDVDDLILNVLGAAVGYFLWVLFRGRTHSA